jgi:hypothetical protein
MGCLYLTSETLQAKNAELEKVVIELRSEAKNIRKTTDDMIKVQEENQTLKVSLEFYFFPCVLSVLNM